MSDVAFFMKYIWKNATFPTKFGFIKKNELSIEILKNLKMIFV